MATTIQISEELQGELKNKRLYEKETYEEVIWNLLEDTKELSEETKKAIKEAEEDYKAGRTITHEQLKKELGI